jgi:hypothetical protein
MFRKKLSSLARSSRSAKDTDTEVTDIGTAVETLQKHWSLLPGSRAEKQSKQRWIGTVISTARGGNSTAPSKGYMALTDEDYTTLSKKGGQVGKAVDCLKTWLSAEDAPMNRDPSLEERD